MFLPQIDLLDQAALLLTGLVALYLFYRFYSRYSKEKKMHDVYYMVSFGALALTGLLLIMFSYSALDDALAEIIGALIPASLALGMVSQFFPKRERAFLIFALIGLVVIAITRFVAVDIGGYVLILVHLISDALVLVLPIVVVVRREARGTFLSVAFGGLLMFITGLSLALLSADLLGLVTAYIATPILLVLSLLLFLMSLAFTFGFVKDIKQQAA